MKCLYKFMNFNSCIYLYNKCLRQFMSIYKAYTMIYKNMQAYHIMIQYIRVYTRIYAYIQIFKTISNLCITTGFEPVISTISCILSAGITTALQESTRWYYILR